jgi:hypothetical protein
MCICGACPKRCTVGQASPLPSGCMLLMQFAQWCSIDHAVNGGLCGNGEQRGDPTCNVVRDCYSRGCRHSSEIRILYSRIGLRVYNGLKPSLTINIISLLDFFLLNLYGEQGWKVCLSVSCFISQDI